MSFDHNRLADPDELEMDNEDRDIDILGGNPKFSQKLMQVLLGMVMEGFRNPKPHASLQVTGDMERRQGEIMDSLSIEMGVDGFGVDRVLMKKHHKDDINHKGTSEPTYEGLDEGSESMVAYRYWSRRRVVEDDGDGSDHGVLDRGIMRYGGYDLDFVEPGADHAKTIDGKARSDRMNTTKMMSELEEEGLLRLKSVLEGFLQRLDAMEIMQKIVEVHSHDLVIIMEKT